MTSAGRSPPTLQAAKGADKVQLRRQVLSFGSSIKLNKRARASGRRVDFQLSVSHLRPPRCGTDGTMIAGVAEPPVFISPKIDATRLYRVEALARVR